METSLKKVVFKAVLSLVFLISITLKHTQPSWDNNSCLTDLFNVFLFSVLSILVKRSYVYFKKTALMAEW